MGDHTESLQIDFDPAQLSLAKIMELYFANRSSCRAAYSRQYMSAIFVHDDAQKNAALDAKKVIESRGTKVHASILPAAQFYLAEDYHQKYMLRNDAPLMRDFKAMYPNDSDFVNSTAAARVNGLLGAGRRASSDVELKSFNLSAETHAYLRTRVKISESTSNP